MLMDKYDKPLTSKRIQELRWRATKLPAAINVPCDAKWIDPSNFLLPGDRCCYCGLPQDLHK